MHLKKQGRGIKISELQLPSLNIDISEFVVKSFQYIFLSHEYTNNFIKPSFEEPISEPKLFSL